MEIFFDSANLKDIEELNSVGIINGVTTNPTILSKERFKLKKLLISVKILI